MKKAPTLDAARLAAYLDSRLGDSCPIEVRLLQGGASNEVFSVDRGSSRWVLRRPPSTRAHASAHDVLREFRFISALHPMGARVPKPVLACDDTSVMGLPFYLMERIEGTPIRYGVPQAYVGRPDLHGRVGEELVDALAEIHAIDYHAAGLAEMGKPEGFLARQPARWRKQLEAYRTRELAYFEDLGHFLENDVPPPQAPAVMHGDYKTDNVLYSLDLPPRIVAVLDWELAAIGDPLLDLAWALFFWPENQQGLITLGNPGGQGGLSLEGLPTRRELAERYARATGRDLSHIGYYTALAGYKLGVILEGNYARYIKGESSVEVHGLFEKWVPEIFARAWRERHGF